MLGSNPDFYGLHRVQAPTSTLPRFRSVKNPFCSSDTDNSTTINCGTVIVFAAKYCVL